jgi:tRNA-Thr(GGU) m(6)t(6)A37 methyltransferase TsaA
VADLIGLKPIGFVREVKGEKSHIEILPDYEPGLLGVKNHKLIFVLYWMHEQKNRSTLQIRPKRDPSKPKIGVFASRSPVRPNPIGLSLVELIEQKGRELVVKGLDAHEGTPILDIKSSMDKEIGLAGL